MPISNSPPSEVAEARSTLNQRVRGALARPPCAKGPHRPLCFGGAGLDAAFNRDTCPRSFDEQANVLDLLEFLRFFRQTVAAYSQRQPFATIHAERSLCSLLESAYAKIPLAIDRLSVVKADSQTPVEVYKQAEMQLCQIEPAVRNLVRLFLEIPCCFPVEMAKHVAVRRVVRRLGNHQDLKGHQSDYQSISQRELACVVDLPDDAKEKMTCPSPSSSTWVVIPPALLHDRLKQLKGIMDRDSDSRNHCPFVTLPVHIKSFTGVKAFNYAQTGVVPEIRLHTMPCRLSLQLAQQQQMLENESRTTARAGFTANSNQWIECFTPSTASSAARTSSSSPQFSTPNYEVRECVSMNHITNQPLPRNCGALRDMRGSTTSVDPTQTDFDVLSCCASSSVASPVLVESEGEGLVDNVMRAALIALTCEEEE